MKQALRIALAPSLLALAACAAAPAQESAVVSTPEGALMDASADLAYAPGELTHAQLTSSTRDLMAMQAMNVFRRFPREVTQDMVRFYTGALALRSLNPIQLTDTQQMILTGVGRAQIKLSAGQPEGRTYALEGGPTGAKGIRFFTLAYPSEQAVLDSFAAAGFPAPSFTAQGDGTEAALVNDPGGFPVQIVIRPGAKPNGDDGVGVGINVTDLETSRAFYRDFVGLDELAPVQDALLGITKYPFRNGETTLYLYDAGPDGTADTGSAGIQYVVRDAAMVEAKRAERGIRVLTPLNKMRGFDLITVWLADPDGVTNYFAQTGPNSRTAQQARAGS
jgi:catechol 2,3-dioxygenase-like lactoylglutathione lyase family enzyme